MTKRLLRRLIRQLEARVAELEVRLGPSVPMAPGEIRQVRSVDSRLYDLEERNQRTSEALMYRAVHGLWAQPSNKPEKNEGEAVPTELVPDYVMVVRPEGIYRLRAGEHVRIPFHGHMRQLWERMYVQQEAWRDHLARNQQRAPRMPELGWFDHLSVSFVDWDLKPFRFGDQWDPPLTEPPGEA